MGERERAKKPMGKMYMIERMRADGKKKHRKVKTSNDNTKKVKEDSNARNETSKCQKVKSMAWF